MQQRKISIDDQRWFVPTALGQIAVDAIERGIGDPHGQTLADRVSECDPPNKVAQYIFRHAALGFAEQMEGMINADNA